MSKTQIPPCPYCADPTLLDAPKGRGGLELPFLPSGAGRFWRSGPPGLLTAKLYGARLVADVPAKSIAEEFAGFAVRLVGVNVGWGFKSPLAPPMYDAQILRAVDSLLGGLTLFSAWTLEGSGVDVRGHWWPTHATLISQRVTLAADGAAGRNEQLERARAALDFFLLETRGAPKIKEVELAGAIRRLGTKATQAAAAKEIGVSPQALRQWAARKGIHTWGEVKSQYKPAEVF